jgi:hypothetical protein
MFRTLGAGRGDPLGRAADSQAEQFAEKIEEGFLAALGMAYWR